MLTGALSALHQREEREMKIIDADALTAAYVVSNDLLPHHRRMMARAVIYANVAVKAGFVFA
jgi:hypothetical protein